MKIHCAMAIGMALLVGSTPAQEAATIEDRNERLSYALGMDMGNRLRGLALEVDPDRYMQGFRDALTGSGTALSAAEAHVMLIDLQRELKQRQRMARSGEPIKNEQGTPETAAAPAAPALADIKVSFKLDSRLTRGLYMGERWVSPPSFNRIQQPGQPLTVEAKAQGIDPKTRTPVPIRPQWIPSDPDMVVVAPAGGDAFNILVKRAGESRLKVTAEGASRELVIKAKSANDALQVEISQ